MLLALKVKPTVVVPAAAAAKEEPIFVGTPDPINTAEDTMQYL
jgi:hypothetical protein